jgi:hypothetical protein
VEKREAREPDRRRGGGHRDADEFWSDIGVDVDGMSPRAQVVTGAVTGGLILLAAAALLLVFTDFWWLLFFFGWAIFPAFGVFTRGVAGLVETRSAPPAPNARERELLEALQRRGELTPAQAAMETSLTVDEADKMLEELAAKGHLEVRVRGGGLFYGLWEDGANRRELREDG